MADLALTLACWDYDITRPLREGTVKPEGINLTYLNVFPAENFQRNLQFNEFDIAEMGLKFYVSTLGLENPPYIAIPVFPVRIFRHSAIYIHRGSGIRTPTDLIGKKVGEPFAYGHDGAIWARGILSDEYGVPANSATYYVGAVDKALRRDFAPFLPQNDIRVEQIPPDQTLDAMLESGELDGMIGARAPSCFLRGAPHVARLFPNYPVAEEAYFQKTKIFPIMHLIGIRRTLAEKHPWLAVSVFKAFVKAKQICMKEFDQIGHLATSLPWSVYEYERLKRLMGEDFWSYGLQSNRHVLETLAGYSFDQGLSARKLLPEEMFARSTHELSKI